VQGYPSVGDLHSTIPVPKDKWFEWGGERSGRFQVRPCSVSARMLWPMTTAVPEKPLDFRHRYHSSHGTVQGLTNADGTLKTECGIHSVR